MNIFQRVAAALLIVFLLTLFFISCGGGGSGETESPPSFTIEIKTPSEAGSCSTDCNAVIVSGTTDYPADRWKNATIKWKNQSALSIAEGMGDVSVESCMGWFLGYVWSYECDAGWHASIPLELGENSITITASDENGATIAVDTIVINKPVMSYSIKGRLTDIEGRALFNMKINQPDTGSFTYTDTNGNYELKCMRNGTYGVVPDSEGFYYPAYVFLNYLNWPFLPAIRTATISDADAVSQDFSTEVYEVSGRITTVYGSAFQNVDVFATADGNGTASSRTDINGSYTLLLPNGSYTIQPSTYFSFIPGTRTVSVSGSALSDQDFAAQ